LQSKRLQRIYRLKKKKNLGHSTAYQINNGSNDYQTGDIGYSIARLFRSKDNFCNIETVLKHSFKIRLKHGIHIVYINIDKIEAALKRAINITEYMTMQLDQISSLSLNTKGSNNAAIYYITSLGDKLQPAIITYPGLLESTCSNFYDLQSIKFSFRLLSSSYHIHRKNDFVEIFTNLISYRSEK